MTESPDEDYRRAAVDLLGAIAYGELSAFERLAAGDYAHVRPLLVDLHLKLAETSVAGDAVDPRENRSKIAGRSSSGTPR